MEAFREGGARRTARGLRTVAAATRQGRARARAAAPPAGVDGEALRSLLATAATEARLVEVPVDRAPWTACGMRVAAGEHVTLVVWGATHLLRALAVTVPSSTQVHVRVRGGAAHVAGSRASTTFTVERDGELEAGSLFPAELDEHGGLVRDRLPHRAITGAAHVVLARWPTGVDVGAALRELADRDPSGLCAAEAARLADPPRAPEGWDHHPRLWPEEVYARSDAGIAIDAHRTVGIVRHPVDDVLLTPTLRARWTWRVDELPSRLPEDTPLTHDYLSVAVEFDDGKDLTWQWSCTLPEGFAYTCPLEHWRHREFHVVARSGLDDVGRWVQEERPVLSDHRVAVGGPAPARVVRAWLIAVSLFQQGRARGEVGRFELVDGDRVVPILGG